MREESWSDQIQHGAEFSWRVKLKQKLTVHWSLRTETKGKFRTLGGVFPQWGKLLTRVCSHTWKWECWGWAWCISYRSHVEAFHSSPLQNTCGSALDDDMASVQVILTYPARAVAGYTTFIWCVNDFYQLPKPLVSTSSEWVCDMADWESSRLSHRESVCQTQ